MKPKFNFALVFTFFALSLMLFTSCQEEIVQETPQNQEETLVPESTLVVSMQMAATNDTSVDNVLDNTNCFEVNLPVTVVVNGVTVTIDSLEDLDVIEDIYNEFDDDEDSLDYLFPITIILNDYEEFVIQDEDQLEDFLEDCLENDEVDVIECVDFVYPISVSIYNTAFQVIDNFTFNNDEELYDFLEDLEDSDQAVIASLDFPVSLVYPDGTTVEVNNNQELEAAIDAAEDDCDDDNYEDDCEVEDVEMYLLECYWVVDSYNGDDHLEDYYFNFMENGTLNVMYGDTTQSIEGQWNMSVSDEGHPEIVISGLDEIEDMNGTWIVYECEDDELVIKQEIDGVLVVVELEQECEDDLDCSAQEIALNLKECKWWMGTSLLSPNYSGPLFFNEDGSINIGYDNGNQLTGTWDVVIGDTGVFLILDVPGDYEPISLEWRVIECEDDRLELVHDENELVLEQECEDDDECNSEDVNDDLLDCTWNVVLHNGSDQYIYYDFDFNENSSGTITNDNNVYEFVWSSTDNEGQMTLTLDVIPIGVGIDAAVNGSWLVVECEDDRLELVNANSSDEMILEQDCENEDPFDCFEDEDIEVCDEGDVFDGMEVFNLHEAFDDCPNDNVEISFFELLMDAEAEVNQIPNDTQYTNTSNPQTVYARVELAGTEIFEVFEVELYVEDCNQSSCTEEEVDDILMECEWNPVLVNGDDNLSSVALLFDESQNVVAEGLGMTMTATWMTSGNPANGVWLTITQFTGEFEALNGQWLVVECSDEMLHLESGDNVMVLERYCPE